MSHSENLNPAQSQREYGDAGMGNYLADRHVPLWTRMVELSGLEIAGKRVLDFGCLEGRFFHHLHRRHLFSFGLGVDIAGSAIARAEAMKGELPVEYRVVTAANAESLLSSFEPFDVAFSHEVIYQIEDLVEHGKIISRALNAKGHYIAVCGCHLESPLWPLWKELRVQHGTAREFPHFDYSPQVILNSFAAAGFSRVTVLPFQWDPPSDFELVPADPQRAKFWPSVEAAKDFYWNHKLLFRCEKDS